MSDMFSEEMKKEFIKLIDKRLFEKNIDKTFDTHRDVYLGIEKTMKELNERLVDIEDNTNDFEFDIDKIKTELEDGVTKGDVEKLVGSTMLKLIPDFNEKIAREIKKHLVSMAEFVIKNFKEKE